MLFRYIGRRRSDSPSNVTTGTSKFSLKVPKCPSKGATLRKNYSRSSINAKHVLAIRTPPIEKDDTQINLKKIESTSVEIKAIHTSLSGDDTELHQNSNVEIDVSLNINSICKHNNKLHHENETPILKKEFGSGKEGNENQFPSNSKNGDFVETLFLDKVTCSIKHSVSNHLLKSGKFYFKINYL